MQLGTIVMMALILTLVWGGFAALLVGIVRAERRRPQGRAPGPGEPPGTGAPPRG